MLEIFFLKRLGELRGKQKVSQVTFPTKIMGEKCTKYVSYCTFPLGKLWKWGKNEKSELKWNRTEIIMSARFKYTSV